MIRAFPGIDVFLASYWQKQPLLIKNAFPAFKDPISPEELAGLACEAEVEARLVTSTKDNKKLLLRSSPFTEQDFTSLPDTHWTLLVQSVDHWFPEVKELLKEVSFLPNWRVDDIMVSYAEEGGSVGPHFDYYDVFLVQGLGTRTWQTGQHCTDNDITINESGLKLLQNFIPAAEYIMEPGDVLYIPPGIAHYGMGNEASMCYSIGFRAPSLSEILINYSDEICAGLSEDKRYREPENFKDASESPGLIDTDTIGRVQEMITAAMSDQSKLARWFGKYMTDARTADVIVAPEVVLSDITALPDCALPALLRNPASRFAWSVSNSAAAQQQIHLFADGEEFTFPFSPELEILITGLQDQDFYLQLADLADNEDCQALLLALYNQGSIIYDEAFDEDADQHD